MGPHRSSGLDVLTSTPQRLPTAPQLWGPPRVARALLCVWVPRGVGGLFGHWTEVRVLRPPDGVPASLGSPPRLPSHSPFLGALHHQFVVTGHKLEFGGPLAHALQALPHRGHGPAASAARSSDPGLPLVRDRWPGPGPHGLRDPIRAARPVRAEGSEARDRGPLFPPPPPRGPAGDLASSAGSSGARRVAGALSGERAVSWSRTPVGRRAGLRREAGAGAGARGRGGPASGASRGRESGVEGDA